MTTPENSSNKHPEDQGAVPSAPITIADAEIAASYVERELHRAKQSRNLTAGVGAFLVLLALIETIVVGGKTADNLRPDHAAQISSALISDRLNDRRDEIRDAIATRLPQFIDQIPDQAIAQLPGIRTNLEKTATDDLNKYATSSSASLKTQLTDYLNSHKDEVHNALTQGKDSAAVHSLAQGLSQQFVQSLQSQTDEGETLQQKLDDAQSNMQSVKDKLDRLAANKGLSADDKRTRRIIAIMVRSINSKAAPVNLNQAITQAQGTVASANGGSSL